MITRNRNEAHVTECGLFVFFFFTKSEEKDALVAWACMYIFGIGYLEVAAAAR